jgi:tetratricopeptide (TPR) repeat protein
VAITSLANIYRNRKEYSKAQEYYEKAIACDPRNTFAWHGKADCLRGLGRYREAVDAWNTALKYGMSKKIVLSRVGDALMNLQEYDQAEESYRRALAAGHDKYAYLGLARLHMIRNEKEEVYRIFKLLLRHDPHDQRIGAEFRAFVERYPELKDQLD